MGFAGYFLIVADFIQWAKRQGIPVGPGRGSGAGSVVAWALTITDLDPLRWGLLFERFLNPERVSMPDFDIDFCQDRRDEVIRYVQQKYGRDRVAQIITFGKLQARAVLRDVGRVLAMPYGQVDRLCKLVPNNPAHPVTLEQAIAGEPLLQQQRDSDESVARLIEIALRLEGLYRHASTHAAGVVIGDRPLSELVPLYRDPRSDMPVTQFNMKWVELAGLVKFDFLGLKTLTVLARCLELLEKRGVELDLAALPLDDPPTFDLLSHGDTVGVFQLEGAGMRDTLKKLRPDRFEDIIAVVSLYRPGPMENIPRYIAVKHGEEQPDYLHPRLEPILKETFGIMIYQEQVMQIAQVLAGYSLGGADLLRRAMGKKIQSEMDAQRQQFVDGRDRARRRAAARRADLRPDGEIRRLRLQQVARRRLCARRLSDRLSEGEPSGRVPGRVDDARSRQYRQARRISARNSTGSASGCCRPTSTARRSRSRSKPTRRPATPRSATRSPRSRGSERRRWRISSPSASATARSGTCSISRRGSTRKASTAASSKASSRPAPSTASTRTGRRASPRPSCCCAKPAAPPRSARAGRRICSPAFDARASRRARPCRSCRIGRRSRSCSTNSTRSVSTCRATRSIAYGAALERAGILRWVDLPAALAANASTRFRLAGIVIGKKERTSARGSRYRVCRSCRTSERQVRDHGVFRDAWRRRARCWKPASRCRDGRCAPRGRRACD